MSRLTNGREKEGAGPLSKTAIAVAIPVTGRPCGGPWHNVGGAKSARSKMSIRCHSGHPMTGRLS